MPVSDTKPVSNVRKPDDPKGPKGDTGDPGPRGAAPEAPFDDGPFSATEFPEGGPF